ncbi:MAG: hypothetical protein HYW25_00610 [Candidatus Aenigmarchaeota archaeon]|nr:hypothetical protein [Candidatus Aenigmarchaeota archaeon]
MTIGKAYAFFDCPASRAKIEAELPDIRMLTKTPQEMELYLAEGTGYMGVDAWVRGDTRLMEVVEDARRAGFRYSMETALPDASDRRAADELAAVMNNAYTNPNLWNGEGGFRGGIVFRGSLFSRAFGRYVSRD